MNEDERYVENLRGALAQAIGIGEKLQARIDSALELLEPLQLNPDASNAIAALRGHDDAE